MSSKDKVEFDLSSLEEFTFTLVLVNLTAKTDVLDSEKIRIIEFMEKGAVIKAPTRAVSVGHSILLAFFPGKTKVKLTFLNPEKAPPESFLITTKVLSSEKVNQTSSHFTLEFVQFLQEDWDRFLKEFSSRQKKVDKIFKQIKE